MPKKADNSYYDAALNLLKNTSVRLCITSAEPANYAGIAAVLLGSYTVTPGDFTGPAVGDISGRKITVNARSGNNASGSGNGVYATLDDGVTLVYGTTVPSRAMVTGEPFSTGAWDIEIEAPV